MQSCIYDIICVTESWLNGSLTSDFLCANTVYTLYRQDRKSREGGGVCVFVKQGLIVEKINFLSDDSELEVLCLDISVPNCSENLCRLILVYRTPAESFENCLFLLQCLESLFFVAKGRIVVLGDFNLPLIDWQNLKLLSFDKFHLEFFEFFQKCFLTQFVHEATRESAVLFFVMTFYLWMIFRF